jgi:PAS domain S-box-containing protein
LIAALLIGLGVLAARYHASVRAEAEESVLARRLALAQLAAATLSERLDRMADLAVSLATRVRFAELVGIGDWTTAADILRKVPAEFPHVERLFLSDLSGTLMADVPPLGSVRGRNFADRDWYQGVSRGWTTHISSVYRRAAEPQRNVIAVATPVRAGGRVAGILVVQLSLEAFFDWAQTIELPEGVALSVVDRKGQAAYATGVSTQAPVADLSTNPGVQRLRQGRSGVELGADKLYAFVLAKHGWSVVIEQPAAVAFAARDMQLRLVWISYALVALFLGAMTWLGRRLASERQAELARARRSLARHGERLRILHKIDRAIVAQQTPESIAAAVIGPLRELLGVPRAIVNKFDLAAGEVEWIAAAGRRRMHVGPGVRYSIRLMGEVEALRRGEPQRIDVHALPHGPEREALLASDVHIYMVVPMLAAGELIGALSFGAEGTRFPPEQLAIAQEVATQLAIAISQARLHERVKRHAEELERRVAERTADLEAAKAQLEDLYNNAPCGYHSVDADGLIVRMNDTWLGWLGYSREEVVGKMHHPDLMTPESAERFRTEAFPLFKRQGWLKEVEFEYVRKDGSTFPGSLQTSTLYDADGRYVTSRTTVFDISARKHAEAAVRELNKELESFSYSISHDLRAPLRAVDGYARMLEEDYGERLDDEARRLLATVRGNAAQMARLIDDLLAFSRLGRKPIAAAPVDMSALAREAAAELAAEHPRALTVVGELPPAHGDRALLKQVWANLIGNALKYSAKGAAPRVEIGGRVDGKRNEYWVRDNGVGFDMRYAAKLFGVFQRLHRAEEFTGTGVGLAIVQRVIARHGGAVRAEAKLNEGACFSFTLPTEEGA